MKKVPKGVKKSDKKRINIKKLVIRVATVALCLYFVYAVIWQQSMISKKNDEIDELKQQVELATDESERLKQEMEMLEDPEYIERIAREKLGLVRPNERVFVDSNKSGDNTVR